MSLVHLLQRNACKMYFTLKTFLEYDEKSFPGPTYAATFPTIMARPASMAVRRTKLMAEFLYVS